MINKWDTPNTVEEGGIHDAPDTKRKDSLSLLRPNGVIVKDRWLIDNFTITKGRRSVGYYSKIDPSINIIKEHPNRIDVFSDSEQAAKAVIRIAQNKEWTAVKLTGSKQFKQVAWLEASRNGMEVKGYKPDKQDLAILTKLMSKDGNAKGDTKTSQVTKAFAEQVEFDPTIVDSDKARLLAMFNKTLGSIEKAGLNVDKFKPSVIANNKNTDQLEVAAPTAKPKRSGPTSAPTKSTGKSSEPDRER